MPGIDITSSELIQLLAGAAVTIAVALLGAVFGSGVGLVLLLLHGSRWSVPRLAVRTYISFVRGTPLLIQIFLIYYALPGLLGIDVPAFAAGVIALSLNSGAFVAEILRGGLSAIPHGQFEAARALGLRPTTLWRRIVLPQLARLVLPPMLNEFTMLVKASALLSVITVVDLTRAAQNAMNTTYRPIEVFTIGAALYFLILSSCSALARAWERRMQLERT